MKGIAMFLLAVLVLIAGGEKGKISQKYQH